MIPREAGRGQSFKGAGAYYLHDKDALTSERVEFTHTENVPTQDPEKALKWMAWTAIHAEDLKRESGAKTTGRPCVKPVFTFSLSWHPEQEPKKWEMIGAGRRALIALGLQDHETVMVAHNDTDHSHLHLIVNVVDPETGKANRVAFSKKKLSAWAEEYEREHGKIYCDRRVENNQKRAQGETVKYEEPELSLKARITKVYRESENGAEFRAALADQGFALARGKKLVLIDRHGKVHSLARQIEGAKEKDIRIKLTDLELPDVDTARKQLVPKPQEAVSEQKEEAENPKETVEEEQSETKAEYFDRDQQDHDWQESIIDAAIVHDKKIQEPPSEQIADVPAKSTPRNPQKRISKLKKLFSEPPRPAPSPSELNRLQDRHLAELGSFYTENTHARLRLAATMDQQYGSHERELRQEVERLDNVLKNSSSLRIWWLEWRKQIPKDAKLELHNLQRSLENIEWRKSEAQQALDRDIAQQRQLIEERQLRERHELHPQPDPQQPHIQEFSSDSEDFDEDLGPAFEL
jgi:hypothetical protein